MGVPLVLIVVGQQIFRVAGTIAAKKAAKAMGGKIVKEIPKNLKKKKVKDEFAFQKLFGEKEPTLFEKLGNVFVRKPKKTRTDSPGRTNVDEGISTGLTRLRGFGRGEQVKGAGKAVLGLGAVGGAGVLAYTKSKPGDTEAVKNSKERLKQLEADLKKSESEKKAAQTATAIEREIGKIIAAESKGVKGVPKRRPRPRPSGNSKGGLIDYRKTGLFK